MTACAGGNEPLIQNGLRAACPDCGHMVVVRLVGGVWVFPPHEDTGVITGEPAARTARGSET